MRTIAWCVLAMSIVGCHSGPRWFMRDHDFSGSSRYDDSSPSEAAPPANSTTPGNEVPTLTVPPQPAQRERTPYETSSRSRGWFGGRSAHQASRSKSSSSTTRTNQTAKRSPAPATATKPAAQDDSVKQLMADLEKIKREKAALETKLSEETTKQTQQRLELEARLALIQEQVRQQSALQQVTFQQQAAAMSRPMSGYSGPMITSGPPNPAMQMPFSSSSVPQYAPQPQPQSVPTWGNSTPSWNAPSTPPQQQVEQWPFSPQRR